MSLMSPLVDSSGPLHDFFMNPVNPMYLLNSVKSMMCTLVRPPHSLEGKGAKALNLREKLAKFFGSKLASTEAVGALFCSTAFRDSDFTPHLLH